MTKPKCTCGQTHNAATPSRNPLKIDPSRTTTLRRKMIQDLSKRLLILKTRVRKLLIDEDAFGLKDDRNIIGNKRFAFLATDEQVKEFQAWLETQTDELLTDEEYWQAYVEEGYRKGQGRAFEQVNRGAKALGLDDELGSHFAGTKDQFLRSAFGNPVAITKVKTLAGRTFTGIKTVGANARKTLSLELVDGLTRGDNPRAIAREMNKRIDASRKDLTRIARTEIIHAHAEGQLDAFEELGVAEVGVAVEWQTAGDDRVCFPAFTLVDTCGGALVPIQSKPSFVATRAGVRAVIENMATEYEGRMVIVNHSGGVFICTEDHPVFSFSLRKEIAAKELEFGETIHGVGDEYFKVLSVVDFAFKDSDGSYSFCKNLRIAYRVAFYGLLVPIIPVYLKGYIFGRKEKI